MASLREFKESPLEIGKDEVFALSFTVPTSWGSSEPTNPLTFLYRVKPDGSLVDVSSTNLTGSTSASGREITTKVVSGLTAARQYRIEIKFTTGNSTLEAYGYIFARE